VKRLGKLLLDQGLAPMAARLLRDAGWDAIQVSEWGLDHAEDASILAFALQDGWACVTLDHDFHSHLALTSAGGPSVVFIRLEGLDSRGQAALIRRVWENCGSEIGDGAAVTADGRRVRVRRLPLR